MIIFFIIRNRIGCFGCMVSDFDYMDIDYMDIDYIVIGCERDLD